MQSNEDPHTYKDNGFTSQDKVNQTSDGHSSRLELSSSAG